MLKDGSQVTGTVLQQQPGQFVTVRTLDGREVTLSWDDVRRVERGTPPPGTAPPPAAPLAPPPATPAPAPAPVTAPEAPSGPPTLGFSKEVQFEEAEKKRKAWLEKGGGIVGYELRAFGMFVMLPPIELQTGYISTNVSGVNDQRGTTEERGLGGGGGVGARIAYMSLNLPDPSAASGWTALRAAVGADFSYAYIGFPVQEVDSGSTGLSTYVAYGTKYEGTSLLLVNVPFQIGGMIGLGNFDGLEWRGVALSASWSPSLTYAKPGEGDGSTDFNYLGFEIGLDILGKDGPMEAAAPHAHGKVFGFLLPPVGDLPLVATLGGGAVWY